MKHFYSKLCNTSVCCVLTTLLLLPAASFAQLSGKYSLDPTATASSTNYTNWASVVSDLVSGTRSDGGTAQGSGVSGAVEFTVHDQVYSNTNISFSAITGSSSTNTITFQSAGGDSTKCKLVRPSGGTTDYVLQLNGADFITFKNMGFERTGTNTSSTVVRITNTSNDNTITNCWLKGRKAPSNSSLGFNYGIGSVIYFVGAGSNTTIENNKLIYGYNGVFSTTSGSGNEILNNVIDTSGSSGVYMTNQTNLKVIGNDLNMGDFGPSTGHYTSYGMRIESSPGADLSKNKIRMLAVNGQVVRAVIVANMAGTSSNKTLVSNNFILNAGGTGDCTGLAVYNSFYVGFFSNNILITNSLKAGSAYYHYAAYSNSNIRLNNNNFTNKGGGYVYNVPGTNTTDLASIDYNNCYTSGSKFGMWNGTDYATFAAWKTGSDRDTNSVNSDPGFSSNTDLHVSNIGINGKGMYLASVLDDIDGEIRSTTAPDIGADEFFPANLDAGISKIDSPAAFCAGTSNVKVIFQNYGITTITKLDVNWSVNGVSQKAFKWTGSVKSGVSSSPINLGSFTFKANTQYSFKVWTVSPNGNSDGKNVNDTITITRQPGLSGTYSIGSASASDYKSFNDAITAMTARGICGATTFNVADGTYDEQITLVQLDGMGAANPVVFQGVSKDSSKVKITLATTVATGNNNAAIQLRGADNTAFKYMTFERTGTNPYGHVVHILGESHNNTFANCQMLAPVVTTANVNSVNIWSDFGIDTGNVFMNNYVQNGYFNMMYGGFSADHENGTVVQGNVFGNAYGSSVQISYTDDLVMHDNTFESVRTKAVSNYDVSLTGCDKELKVTNNRFVSNNTDTSLFIDACRGTTSGPGLIANNLLLRKNGIGFLLNAVEYQQVVFNNMNFTGDKTRTTAISTTPAKANDIVLKNNCIAMDSGLVYRIFLKGHVSSSDHNNLFTNDVKFAEWNAKLYWDMASFTNISKMDSNSIGVDPLYKSATDLHVTHPALYDAGTPIAGVTLDIDGDARTSLPDIGADEFTIGPDDASISTIVEPSSGVCAGTYSVKAVIRNLGNNSLTSASVGWDLNGNAQTGISWTGTLSNRQGDTLTLGTLNLKGGATPVIRAWTTSPNGKKDGFPANDTFSSKVRVYNLPFAYGGKDKKLCIGDSVQLGIPGASGNEFLWTDTAKNILTTKSRVYVQPSVTSDFIFTLINTQNNCVNRDTVKVVVVNYPVADAGTDVVICEGDSLQLGSTPIITDEYNWTSNPASFVSTTAQPKVGPTGTTTYILEQKVIGSQCATTDSVVITVSPVPVASVTGVLEACDEAIIGYKAGSKGNTYQWTLTGATTIDGAATDSITVKWSPFGSGSIQLVESNAYCADTATLSITVHENPNAEIQIEGSCAGRDVIFTDLSTAGTRAWDFGDGGTATKKKSPHNYAAEGSYKVGLTVTTDKGCQDTAQKQFTAVKIPAISFEIPNQVCEQNELSFNNTSTGADTYRWDFNDGNTSTDENGTHTYTEAKLYTVQLLGDKEGCSDSLTKSVIVDPLPDASFTTEADWYNVKVTPATTDGSKYEWDFGDGETSTDTEPTHTYDIPDTKEMTITLTLTSKDGCENTSTQQVEVIGTGIDERLPKGINTLSTYPNPFEQSTRIEMDLNESIDVEVTLFDIRGQELGTLLSQKDISGTLQIDINGSDLNLVSGTYVVRILVDQEHLVKQVIQMK